MYTSSTLLPVSSTAAEAEAAVEAAAATLSSVVVAPWATAVGGTRRLV